MGNASPLVGALEDAWLHLQGRFPDLLDTVIVLGTGAGKKGMSHWGSWTYDAWRADGKKTGEFFLAGERLGMSVNDVYMVLLHEAAHALAQGRGIKDTSRNNRYHNERFRLLAVEMGLTVHKVDTYGWTDTRFKPNPADTEQAAVLASIKAAMKIKLPMPAKVEEDDKPPASPSIVHECACPRKLRLKARTIEEGPISCGVCGEEFLSVQ